MAFPYSDSLWFLFIVEVSLYGQGWTSGCQGFGLGKLASVFGWVDVDYFSLEWNEVSSSEFWDVCGFGVTLGSLYIEAQGYVPALLENLRGMSCSGTCCLLGGTWFQCRYGGFWMHSYRLMFSGVRSSLVFSGFGLKPPASIFSLILTVASRLLHLYSTDDKTSRLMMKSFSKWGTPRKVHRVT